MITTENNFSTHLLTMAKVTPSVNPRLKALIQSKDMATLGNGYRVSITKPRDITTLGNFSSHSVLNHDTRYSKLKII